jgi:PAS domain S-box-containing protein
LHQLSIHLSLALQQAELYQNLENLNVSLEQRTQALQLQNKVLEDIHDAVITTNFNDIILSWNHGAEKSYGYKESEVLGRNIAFLYEDMETLQAQMIVPLLEKDRHDTEIVVISKSGERIDISLRLSVVKDEQGDITHLIGCVSDITDRKRAEQELQRLNQELENRVIERTAELAISERRYSTLASASPVGIFRFDSPLNCVYVNERWSQLTGRSAESAMGRGWIESLHPDDRDLILESAESQFYSPLSEKDIFSGEGRHLRPDGSVNWFYWQVAKEFNEAGEIVGYIGTLTDISDRKQTELALMESEAKFRRLVEGTNDLIWSKNAEGIFTYLSPQFQTLFGFDPKDWIGKIFSDLLHPDDLNWMMSGFIHNRQAKQKINNLEFRHLHQDGHYIWVSSNTTPILSAEGRFMGSQGILTDISERKLAEAELKQKNIELEELVKLREETLTLRVDMSNMIIHDLRNPLTAMLLSAEIIQRYGDRPDKKTLMLKKAEQILTSGQRLKDMIDNLLLMAKLESGKILFNPILTDLYELGIAILNDFELSANTQKIELTGDLPRPKSSIVIDAIILHRVIENLLSNALKFSPPHSQVCLRIECLPENHLRVQVIDQGPGVSPERTQDIFKKFEIGAVKQNVSQIGLGLAFCKMAVEAQGGTLAIAPNQPQGSIFTVEI